MAKRTYIYVLSFTTNERSAYKQLIVMGGLVLRRNFVGFWKACDWILRALLNRYCAMQSVGPIVLLATVIASPNIYANERLK